MRVLLHQLTTEGRAHLIDKSIPRPAYAHSNRAELEPEFFFYIKSNGQQSREIFILGGGAAATAS